MSRLLTEEARRAQDLEQASLGLLVAKQMKDATKHYAIQHALLSALPCTEV